MKLTIVNKILYIFLSFVAVIIVFGTIWKIKGEYFSYQNNLDEKINMLVRNVADNSAYFVLAGDMSNIERITSSMVAQKDIVYCGFADNNGNIIFQISEDTFQDIRRYKADILTEIPERGEEQDELIFGGGKKAKVKIGEVLVNISMTEYLQKTRVDIYFNIVLGLFIGFILLLFLYYTLNSIIKSHLVNFISGIEKISSGDFNFRIPVEAKDEMSKVSLAFNNMAETLKNSVVSKDHLESIIQNIADGIAVTDSEGRITIINRALMDILGISEGEAEKKDITALLGGGTAGIFNLTKFRDIKDVEITIMSKTGVPIISSISCSVLMKDDYSTSGFIFLVKDLREFMKLQNQLLQSEKMSAIGKLASGVAHEINNPLTVILGYAQILLKKIKKDHEYFRPVELIEKESKRSKNLVDQLLQFSRVEKPVFELFDLNNAVEEIIQIIMTKSKLSGILLLLEIDPKAGLVKGSKNQLQQVITNICNNAIDATPAGGKVLVTTKHIDEYALLEIEDNGAGIPEVIQNRIFEPFFTTKDVGKGTGLGLSLSFEILKRHNFEITFESKSGKGTKFIIKMPYEKRGESLPGKII